MSSIILLGLAVMMLFSDPYGDRNKSRDDEK